MGCTCGFRSHKHDVVIERMEKVDRACKIVLLASGAVDFE